LQTSSFLRGSWSLLPVSYVIFTFLTLSLDALHEFSLVGPQLRQRHAHLCLQRRVAPVRKESKLSATRVNVIPISSKGFRKRHILENPYPAQSFALTANEFELSPETISPDRNLTSGGLFSGEREQRACLRPRSVCYGMVLCQLADRLNHLHRRRALMEFVNEQSNRTKLCPASENVSDL
jgi:hypothetical protein